MSRRPLIGITGRRLSASAIAGMDPRYHNTEIDFVFNDYARCVAAAGAVPVHLPYQADAAAVIDHLDGVLITGGQDVHPSCWGGDQHSIDVLAPDRTQPSTYDRDRDHHEIDLIRSALARAVPLLGICRGAQVLNVACGGTLIPDLPPGPIEHYSTHSAPTAGADNHLVTFTPGTLAHRIFGPQIITNSWHHQSVNACGEGVIVSGRAADEVVETIEVPGRPALGVQWHPEWHTNTDASILWLVAAAYDRSSTPSTVTVG